MNKMISGIRPSGKLHLGNYIGSILPALRAKADVLVAQYHAPEGDATALVHELKQFFDSSSIKLQHDTFDADLYFKLLSVTPSGLLSHMPQYKEKAKTANMFVYPVLMAADIADYDYVIVGEDQRPHIELAGDILPKVGKSCPQAIYSRKVMDLRHPDRKMSKSDPDSCLFISDSSEVIEHKIKKAVTTPDGRSNLEFIYITINGAHRITNKLRNTSNSELKDALTMSLLELWDK